MAGKYLTTGQAARLLGVSNDTILSAVRAGKLQASHRTPGGAYRFEVVDLEHYVLRRISGDHVGQHARAVVSTQTQPSVFPSPARKDPGALTHVVPLAEDVTDRRRAEAALQQSGALLRSLYEHAPIGVVLVSLEGRCLMANPSLQRLLGYDEEELRGMHFTEYAHAEDSADDLQLFGQVVAGTRDSYSLEKRYIRKDGRTVWGQLGVSVVRDQHGLPQLVVRTLLDLSERHAAEERLRGSEEHYRRIVETSLDGMFEVDADDRFVFVNRRLADITGYAPNEMLGMPSALLREEKEQTGFEARAAARRAGDVSRMQYERTVRRKDGTLRWVQMSMLPILGERGEYAGEFGMVADIHQRKQAEQALRQSEQEFRLLAENSSDMIVRLTMDLVVLYASPAARQLTGFEPGGLVGRQGLEFVHPDDVDRVKHALVDVRREPDADAITYRHLRADGSYVWVESTGRGIRDASTGEVLEIQVTTRDVSERRRTEDALREVARERSEEAAIAEALSEASAALGSALEPEPLYARILEQMARVVPCTGAYIFGYRGSWAVVAGAYGEPRPPMGLQIPGFVGPGGLLGLGDQPRLLSETRDTPGWQVLAPWEGEYEVRSTMILPLVVHGETYGCLAVGSSVPHTYTAQHLRVVRAFSERIEQALWNSRLYQLEQERARAAEHLASLRNEFVATVSHELRTPLTAVLGYAEVLSGHWDRMSEAQRKANVQRIVTAANRQKRLVDDLLRVSTLDGDETPVQRAEVSVLEIVSWAMDEVKGSYPSQAVEVAGPPDLVVVADPLRMEQVLVNLLDNAAKYSPEGSSIELEWTQEDGMAVVRVRDHGPGIPPEGREVLFSRFGRVPGSKMRAGHVGTGLGLFLGRAYARAMGGSLELERTGPDGSVFSLRLPLCTVRVQRST